MVVVLFILGIVIAMAAAITNALMSTQRLSTTTTRLANVDAALLQFVMQQKRMPCPANITRATNDPLYGKGEVPDDTTGCPGPAGVQEKSGVVPWVDLGLAQADVTDGWGRLFTYRVSPVLAAKNGMDMSWCDPAGAAATVTAGGQAANTCNTGCSSSSVPPLTACTSPANFLSAAGRGLVVQNLAGAQVMTPPTTGAAYVLVSHGQTGGHGYTPTGQLFPGTTTDGTEEQKNYPDVALRAYYVDDSISDASGATHFDDIVSRPSLMTVINKAGLGPRSHP
jgi:hypothetical protein